jgi:RNA polymerase sigma-70 factor, ECF subfamily
MNVFTADTAEGRAVFDRLLNELRPKLHRYCARMTGSVIDGEDLAQEALLKAVEALPHVGTISCPEPWLFRIAHNSALNFLQRRARLQAAQSDEDPDMIVDPRNHSANRDIAAASLRTFMGLPVAQRGSVILMDVLGYSLDEISGIIGSSVASIKANLHRGRTRLRELSREQEEISLPVLTEPERSRLALYVDRFNERNFDAIRDMLADDVRLELVGAARRKGRSEVGTYLGNYGRTHAWHLVPGIVDGRPAVLVRNPADPSGQPVNFILLEWTGNKVSSIRDFTHARYVIDGAAVKMLCT